MRYDETLMRRAIEISAEARTTPGTEPFGAVVVRDGRIVGERINRSVQNHDPASHGETEAIRDACRRLGTVDLLGCRPYTSCEPCALCDAAMEIAEISHLYCAAEMVQAGAALGALPKKVRFPINVDRPRHECAHTIDKRHLPAMQAVDREAAEILNDWTRQAVADRSSRNS